MTKEETEAIWDLLFGIAFIIGDLSCNLKDDDELHKWTWVKQKDVHDNLKRCSDEFMNKIGWNKEATL